MCPRWLLRKIHKFFPLLYFEPARVSATLTLQGELYALSGLDAAPKPFGG